MHPRGLQVETLQAGEIRPPAIKDVPSGSIKPIKLQLDPRWAQAIEGVQSRSRQDKLEAASSVVDLIRQGRSKAAGAVNVLFGRGTAAKERFCKQALEARREMEVDESGDGGEQVARLKLADNIRKALQKKPLALKDVTPGERERELKENRLCTLHPMHTHVCWQQDLLATLPGSQRWV